MFLNSHEKYSLHTVAGPRQLYSNRRNINSFIASLYIQKSIKCSCTIMKSTVLHTFAVQLYSKSRNINSFTASLYLE
jgi:hypothetical protein